MGRAAANISPEAREILEGATSARKSGQNERIVGTLEDATGLPRGFMSVRWTYPEPPVQLPSVRVTKVRFDEVRAHLPPETGVVTPEERREAIRVRQEHVQRRYRQH